MKKTIISTIIFIFMVFSIFYLHFKLNTICEKIINYCSSLEDIVYYQNWDESYESSVELLDYIQASYSPLAIYVTHTEIDNLRTETAKLSEYIQTQELPEAMASIHYIKFTAENIKNMQEVNFQNIL